MVGPDVVREVKALCSFCGKRVSIPFVRGQLAACPSCKATGKLLRGPRKRVWDLLTAAAVDAAHEEERRRDAAILVANFEKARAAGDLQGMSLWKGWAALEHYEAGQDPLPAKREALRLSLEALRAGGFSIVEIVVDEFPPFGTPGACKECKKLAGKKMPIVQALALMPLPHATCTRDMGKGAGWCRCGFLPV